MIGSMNLEDPAVLSAFVSQLKNAGDELVDRLGAVMQSALSTAASDLTAISDRLGERLEDTETKTMADVGATITGLDGWRLDIGPITIPAFPIRLSKKGTS